MNANSNFVGQIVHTCALCQTSNKASAFVVLEEFLSELFRDIKKISSCAIKPPKSGSLIVIIPYDVKSVQ